MKTAVETIFIAEQRRYNRRFLQMCSHHVVEPVACSPASGWENGQVETKSASLERVRRKLSGPDEGDRQMVEVLAAVLTDGLPAVEAACAQALAERVHSADVILNILARRRDPSGISRMPPGSAASIQRHAPVANCARYDSLRSGLNVGSQLTHRRRACRSETGGWEAAIRRRQSHNSESAKTPADLNSDWAE